MACPYFMPLEKLVNGNWPHPSRLPLGAGWDGHCTAPGHDGERPAQDVLEAFCNLGYADCCRWAPRERSWDAVRFAVVAPRENGKSRGELGAVLRLSFVCEKNHRPADHGELELDLARSAWLRSHTDTRIQRMAECFVTAYLQKKA